MSKNCAIKYADIEAKTAKGEAEKTKLKVSSLIGDELFAGKTFPKRRRPIEKIEDTIPITTTWLAFLFPNISEIISVIKKVIGYGRTPTDNSKSFIPNTSKSNGYHEKNFWKIRLDTTKAVMKIEPRNKYNFCANNLFSEFKTILCLS